VRHAAAACGMSTSEWARLVLVHAAGDLLFAEQLERAGEAAESLLRGKPR